MPHLILNVNAVAPGLTDTPVAQFMIGDYSLDSFGERITVCRLGKPEDMEELSYFEIR